MKIIITGGGGVVPIGPVIIDDDETTDIINDGNSTSGETDEETTITTTENNETSLLTNVNILSISSYANSPLFINVNCEAFNKINYENLNLLFVSSQNSFQTEVCNLPNSNPITSFSCKLPNNMPNGEYSIRTPSDNKYNINYSRNAYVNNGIISFDYIDYNTQAAQTQVLTETTNNIVDTTVLTDEVTQKIYDPIVIISSFNRTIQKGDKITLQINSIEKDKYKLDNNEIIFEDTYRTIALYLKKCEEQNYNGNILSIRCTLSDNIMKGTYSILAVGQNIYIGAGNSINLISEKSTGGIFRESIDRNINTNLTKTQLKNLNLTFNLLYYNSSLKPGKIFPHKVYLYGNKKALRNLDDTIYNHVINFPSCTAGSYSKVDKSAIGSIYCKLPDYIPAGTYSKLESDGFDVMPSSKVNLVFNNDFNRNSTSSNSNSTSYDKVQTPSKSSSKSKTWIIWLVLGILVLILLIVIIIVCCLNKKSADVSANSDNGSKESIENSSQDKKSDISEN